MSSGATRLSCILSIAAAATVLICDLPFDGSHKEHIHVRNRSHQKALGAAYILFLHTYFVITIEYGRTHEIDPPLPGDMPSWTVTATLGYAIGTCLYRVVHSLTTRVFCGTLDDDKEVCWWSTVAMVALACAQHLSSLAFLRWYYQGEIDPVDSGIFRARLRSRSNSIARSTRQRSVSCGGTQTTPKSVMTSTSMNDIRCNDCGVTV